MQNIIICAFLLSIVISGCSRQQEVSFISPNRNLKLGEQVIIQWKATEGIEKVDIHLESWHDIGGGGPLTWAIAENISASDGSCPWVVGTCVSNSPEIMPQAQYLIHVIIVKPKDERSYYMTLEGASEYFGITE